MSGLTEVGHQQIGEARDRMGNVGRAPEAEMDRTIEVFVSHAGRDEEFGNNVVDQLLIAGLQLREDQIFYSSRDATGVPVSENWFEYIRKVLHQMPIMVVLLSENYWRSPMSMFETGAALMFGKPYILRSHKDVERRDLIPIQDKTAKSVRDLVEFMTALGVELDCDQNPGRLFRAADAFWESHASVPPAGSVADDVGGTPLNDLAMRTQELVTRLSADPLLGLRVAQRQVSYSMDDLHESVLQLTSQLKLQVPSAAQATQLVKWIKMLHGHQSALHNARALAWEQGQRMLADADTEQGIIDTFHDTMPSDEEVTALIRRAFRTA